MPSEFRGRRIVVVGDAMIDKSIRSGRSYHHQDEDLLVVSAYLENGFPGGASNIAANVSALGGEAVHLGVVGDDGDAAELRAALRRSGVGHILVADPSRPTTKKLRIYHGERPVVRVDTESTEPIGDLAARKLLAQCLGALDGASALVLSDYRKGVVTAPFTRSLLARARSLALPVIVDSKATNIGHFEGCTLFKANRHELEAVLRCELSHESGCGTAVKAISKILGGSMVVMTDGERGVLYLDSDGHCHRAFPPPGRTVTSVVGAGDTVTAVLALGIAVGMDMPDVADLALHAAAEAIASADTTAVRGHS
ncbi:bifunctional heptose 7-phosphate kinase/heptose 1-phosphate adenyltransferase [Actinomadura sp. 9N215]